jgi:YCII-related domain
MHIAYALTPRNHARTIRAAGPADGPYGAGGDVIAGFYILNATDIDEALDLARKDPSILTGGGVEVRPVHSGGVVAVPEGTLSKSTHAVRCKVTWPPEPPGSVPMGGPVSKEMGHR